MLPATPSTNMWQIWAPRNPIGSGRASMLTTTVRQRTVSFLRREDESIIISLQYEQRAGAVFS